MSPLNSYAEAVSLCADSAIRLAFCFVDFFFSLLYHGSLCHVVSTSGV